jgi:predicted GNAT family acetyltransferase
MIVADSNIVSTFARIGRLDLLFAVTETDALHLPPAVIKEIKAGLHNCLAHQIPAFNLKLILRRLWQANHSTKEEVRTLIEEIERSEPGMVIKGKDEVFR